MNLEDPFLKIAKSQRSTFDDIFERIAHEFGVYGQTTSSFSMGANYLNNDAAGSLSPNKAALTTEPLYYIELAAASLSFFTIPSTNNSIAVSLLKDAIVQNGNSAAADRTLESAGRIVQKILMNPSRRFHAHLTSAVKQLLLFGNTAFLTSNEDPLQPEFKCIDLREIYVYKNDEGKITHIWREFVSCSPDNKNKKFVQKYELIEREGVFNPMAGEMLVTSTLCNDRGEVLEKSELPYWPITFVSLFEDPGYAFGSGLGVRMLPHAARLNGFKRMLFNAGHLQIQPSYQIAKDQIVSNLMDKDGKGKIDHETFTDPFTYIFKPCQVIPVRGSAAVLTPIQQSLDLSPFMAFAQEELVALRAHCFLDILTIADLSSSASVEEIVERVNMKLQVLSPLVSSVQCLIDGVVKKIFSANLYI